MTGGPPIVGVSFDGSEHLGRHHRLVDPIERDHTSRQGVPLLSPLTGPVPHVDHLGEAPASLVDPAEM